MSKAALCQSVLHDWIKVCSHYPLAFIPLDKCTYDKGVCFSFHITHNFNTAKNER